MSANVSCTCHMNVDHFSNATFWFLYHHRNYKSWTLGSTPRYSRRAVPCPRMNSRPFWSDTDDNRPSSWRKRLRRKPPRTSNCERSFGRGLVVERLAKNSIIASMQLSFSKMALWCSAICTPDILLLYVSPIIRCYWILVSIHWLRWDRHMQFYRTLLPATSGS